MASWGYLRHPFARHTLSSETLVYLSIGLADYKLGENVTVGCSSHPLYVMPPNRAYVNPARAKKMWRF
jgi:hypothetical protein